MMTALRVTMWFAAVVLLVLFAAARGTGLQAALPDADERLVYPLDAPVRFAVQPGEQTVRLTTWLTRPTSAWEGDPRVEQRWCLDLGLEDPAGTVTRTWRAWISSRTSLQEDGDGRVRPRSALPDPTQAVTLGRPLLVDLAGLAPAGGVLTVRSACTAVGERVLALGQRLAEREWSTQLQIDRSEGPIAQRLAESVGFSRWSAVPAPWRGPLLARRWQRLGALTPAEGGEPRTVRLFQRDGQTALDEASVRGTLVPPGGAVAWNLQGAVVFSAEWTALDGEPATPTGAWGRAVFADGTVRDLGAIEGSTVGPWSFDAAVTSVQIALARDAAPTRIRAYARRGDADPVWGDPPRIALTTDTSEVSPDLRTVELTRVHADPVRYSLRGVAAARLSFWVPVSASELSGFEIPPPPAVAGSVTLEALDEADRVVETWEVPLAPVASPFERYSMVTTPADAAVGATSARIFVPRPEEVALRLSSSRPVDVGLRVTDRPWSPSAARPEYPLPEDAPVRAEWVPHEQDSWVARSPEDYEALAAVRRIVHVDGQVRLEPRTPRDEENVATSAREWHAFALSGPHEVLAVPAEGDDGTHTRLGSVATEVMVGADGRLPVTYRAPLSALGRVVFDVDGQRMAPALAVAADVIALGPLHPGPAMLAVEQGVGDARLHGGEEGLFLAPTAHGGAWRLRNVWPVVSENVWRIPLAAGGGAVSVRTWLDDGDGGDLRWRIVPGAHDTLPGLYDRTTTLAGDAPLRAGTGAPAVALSMDHAPLHPSDPRVIPVGGDLPPGSDLEITVSGTRAPAWVQVSTTWDGRQPVPGDTNWRTSPVRIASATEP